MKEQKIKSFREIKFEKSKYIILVLVLLLAFLFSMTLGRFSLSLSQLGAMLLSRIPGVNINYPAVFDTIIFQVRLSRVFVAMTIRASLSISGAAYQAVFKNPMVSPDILGASAGAGFGAASRNTIIIRHIKNPDKLLSIWTDSSISNLYNKQKSRERKQYYLCFNTFRYSVFVL